ncbi:MAG: PIN domain-containing protein [Coriobacteriia bacterium]|nr:PIN domain-containing protein [Coriobacteriia bacterium]
MTARVLLDTSVFAHAVDRSEPEKSARARAVLDHVGSWGAGVLSPQVVAEFVSASRRLRAPLSVEQVAAVIDRVLYSFEVLPLDERVMRETLRCWRRYSVSYWDAQIWATARIGGVSLVVTEDVIAAELEGVRYIDPFESGFSLTDLGLSG